MLQNVTGSESHCHLIINRVQLLQSAAARVLVKRAEKKLNVTVEHVFWGHYIDFQLVL